MPATSRPGRGRERRPDRRLQRVQPPGRVLLARAIGLGDELVVGPADGQLLARVGVEQQRLRGLGAAVDAEERRVHGASYALRAAAGARVAAAIGRTGSDPGSARTRLERQLRGAQQRGVGAEPGRPDREPLAQGRRRAAAELVVDDVRDPRVEPGEQPAEHDDLAG